MEEKKKEFLTPEQRKGLLYGSLISAVLSGGAALRSGGNVTDALGRGALGAAQAFGGGLEEVANLRHREIEEDKMLEAMRASQESTALAKKSAASREAHEAAQTKEAGRATAEKTANAAALEKFLASQRPPSATPYSAMTPEQLSMIEGMGSRGVEGIQSVLKPTTGIDKYYDVLTNRMVSVPKTEPGPVGAVTPAMVIAAEKEKGSTQRAEMVTKTAEKVSKTGAESREKVAQVGAESRGRVAETGAATAAAKVKNKVYWDYDNGAPVELPEGKQGINQGDPDRDRIAKRLLEKYRLDQSRGKAHAAPAATIDWKKYKK